MRIKHVFLFTMLLTFAVAAFGQSPSKGLFNHLQAPSPPTQPIVNKYARSLIVQDSILPTPSVDSSFQGLRLTGISVLVAVPNWTLYTGTGISYEHDTYSVATKRWTTSWAVNVGAYLGGQFAPTSLKSVGALGASVALFNKLLVLGVLYNFGGTQHWQAATGGNANIVPTN